MKDLLLRLRAALTPQVIILLAAALLLTGMLASGHESSLTLEQRLQRTLSGVDGAGRVFVTIRCRESSDTRLGSASFGAAAASEIPCGAVVVAQGAGDPIVEMELRQAVCAILGLSASSVSVIKGGE